MDMLKENGQHLRRSSGAKRSLGFLGRDTAFRIFMIAMVIYYGLRMFMITPWYDELYTYYWFISRGPLYAAIHWPLPNNHVGYSVLSSILMLTHNGYIALRGVSYAAALFNLYLLHRMLKDAFGGITAFAGIVLYSGLGSIMNLAVQGRGYTLSITFMLIMIMGSQAIIKGSGTKKNYLLVGLGAVAGLYTVPSSLYFVVMVFIAAGVILLIENKRRELGKTVICAVISAVVTFALYSIIWLAVGSNLLVKDRMGSYFGMSHVSVIMKSFPSAWKAGFDYMLASPYIQSVPHNEFAGKMISWIQSEMTEMSGMNGIVTLAVLILCIIVSNIYAFRRKNTGRKSTDGKSTDGKSNGSKDIAEERPIPGSTASLVSIADIGFFGSIFMMIVSFKLPYFRVFAFWGVYIAVFAAGTISCVIDACRNDEKRSRSIKPRSYVKAAGILFAAASLMFMIRSVPFHSYQYGEREDMAADALRKTYYFSSIDDSAGDGGLKGTIRDSSKPVVPAVTDCEQQYLMKFMFGDVCENTEVNGCDYVIIDKDLVAGNDEKWEYLTDHDSIDWDYVFESMREIYDNTDFTVYTNR